MNCPKCGASNRDAASYCDSCGAALVEGLVPEADSEAESEAGDLVEPGEGDREPLVGSGGLVGLMAIDWTLRFGAVAFIGILVGLITLGMGEYGFSAFFFGLGVVGIVGTWGMVNAKR